VAKRIAARLSLEGWADSLGVLRMLTLCFEMRCAQNDGGLAFHEAAIFRRWKPGDPIECTLTGGPTESSFTDDDSNYHLQTFIAMS